MISKQTNNTGATGNHGMSKIDVKNELAKQENDMKQDYKGYRFACSKCNENFEMNDVKYSPRQKGIVRKWLSNNHCPYCDNWKSPEFFRRRNFLVEHLFTIDGVDYKALRVPEGYRPKKIIKCDSEGKPIY